MTLSKEALESLCTALKETLLAVKEIPTQAAIETVIEDFFRDKDIKTTEEKLVILKTLRYKVHPDKASKEKTAIATAVFQGVMDLRIKLADDTVKIEEDSGEKASKNNDPLTLAKEGRRLVKALFIYVKNQQNPDAVKTFIDQYFQTNFENITVNNKDRILKFAILAAHPDKHSVDKKTAEFLTVILNELRTKTSISFTPQNAETISTEELAELKRSLFGSVFQSTVFEGMINSTRKYKDLKKYLDPEHCAAIMLFLETVFPELKRSGSANPFDYMRHDFIAYIILIEHVYEIHFSKSDEPSFTNLIERIILLKDYESGDFDKKRFNTKSACESLRWLHDEIVFNHVTKSAKATQPDGASDIKALVLYSNALANTSYAKLVDFLWAYDPSSSNFTQAINDLLSDWDVNFLPPIRLFMQNLHDRATTEDQKGTQRANTPMPKIDGYFWSTKLKRHNDYTRLLAPDHHDTTQTTVLKLTDGPSSAFQVPSGEKNKENVPGENNQPIAEKSSRQNSNSTDHSAPSVPNLTAAVIRDENSLGNESLANKIENNLPLSTINVIAHSVPPSGGSKEKPEQLSIDKLTFNEIQSEPSSSSVDNHLPSQHAPNLTLFKPDPFTELAKTMREKLIKYRETLEKTSKQTWIYDQELGKQKRAIIEEAERRLPVVDCKLEHIVACINYLEENKLTLSKRRDTWFSGISKIAGSIGLILIYRLIASVFKFDITAGSKMLTQFQTDLDKTRGKPQANLPLTPN